MMSTQMEILFQSACLFCAITYPALCLIYQHNPPQDMNKMRSFRRSLPVIFLFLAIKLGIDQSNMEPNLYRMLDVSRHSSPFEIRQAYKTQSLFHHPDKSPSGSDNKFYVIKAAYDILIDGTKRDVYNRFGVDGVESDPRLDEISLFVEIFIVYLFWGILAYIITIPTSSRSSRPWIAVLGVIMIATQSLFTMLDTSLPSFFKTTIFSKLTEYEFILFLHSMFPCFMLCLVFLAEGYYFDLNSYTLKYLEKSVCRNRELCGLLEHLQLLANKSIADESIVRENTEKLEEDLRLMINRLSIEDKETADILKEMKVAGSSSTTNYLGIIFIVFIIVLQLV